MRVIYGVRGKIAALIAVSTLFTALFVSFYVGKFILYDGLLEDAGNEAKIAIQRSANMFMVSTLKFQTAFEKAATQTEKDKIREDWVRTIVAVDDAVVHDFGKDILRVRLINDQAMTKQPSLGGAVTAIEQPFEREALQSFVTGRKDPFSRNEDAHLRVAVPLFSNIHPGCANCHGIPVTESRLLGTLNAYIPLGERLNDMWMHIGWTALIITVLVGGVMGMVWMAMNRLILRRVQAIGTQLKMLPEMEGFERRGHADEIEDMSRAVQVLQRNLAAAKELEQERVASQQRRQQRTEQLEQWVRQFDQDISTVLHDLTGAAGQMRTDAQLLAATAEQTSRQSSAVAVAATQTSANVQTVAQASRQLTDSIDSIAQQVAESAAIAQAAEQEADRTNTTVTGLSEAAVRIGEVVALINSIASQTNLLALNATIEAARAGEAGKGFAVVAGEVKNLANQTAKATGDIQAQVGQIQAVAEQTVGAIQAICGTIGRMRQITLTVATAVEQQGAATLQIALNIDQASEGTSEVSENISDVTRAAGETGNLAVKTLSAAGTLANRSDVLRQSVDSFISRVRGL